MASVKISHVVKVMAENDARFYSVKDNGKVLDEQDNLAVDTEAAIAMLQDTFAGLTGSFVTVMISNKNRMDKGNGRSKDLFQREFTVMLGTDKQAVAGVSDNLNAFKDLLRENQQLREQLLEQKHQTEIDLIRKEFNEFKDLQNAKGMTGIPLLDGLLENETVQLKLVDSLTGFLGGAKATALAGIDETTEQYIEHIKTVDPDFEAITLPALAKLALTKPDTYKQGILFLKGSL